MYSLHTKDRAEAKRLALIETVEKDRLIQDARAGARAAEAQYPTAGGTPAPIKLTSEEGWRRERAAFEHDMEQAEAAFREDEATEGDPAKRLIRDALEGARAHWDEDQRQSRADLRQRRA